MEQVLRKNGSIFSYKDYRAWPNEERWELIGGIAWNMCAAPNRGHQAVLGELFSFFHAFLKGKPCRVFMAPFDVLFPESPEQADDDVITVVQPDLVVFCDKSKLTAAGARGSPDLVAEILSPWTSKKDLNDKFSLYERSGVREYWVLDPSGSIQAYRLTETNKYGDPEILVGRGVLSSTVLGGFTLDIAALFAAID